MSRGDRRRVALLVGRRRRLDQLRLQMVQVVVVVQVVQVVRLLVGREVELEAAVHVELVADDLVDVAVKAAVQRLDVEVEVVEHGAAGAAVVAVERAHQLPHHLRRRRRRPAAHRPSNAAETPGQLHHRLLLLLRRRLRWRLVRWRQRLNK